MKNKNRLILAGVISLLLGGVVLANEVKYKTKQEILEVYGNCTEDSYNYVPMDYCPLMFANDALKKDREVVLCAVSKPCSIATDDTNTYWVSSALQFADDTLKKDKEIILTALKNTSLAFQFVDDSFKNDKKLVANLLNSGQRELFEYAGDELKKDKDIVRLAMKMPMPWVIFFNMQIRV